MTSWPLVGNREYCGATKVRLTELLARKRVSSTLNWPPVPARLQKFDSQNYLREDGSLLL